MGTGTPPLDRDAAILAILGTDEAESADQHEIERLSALWDSPIRVNLATRSRLLATGLFTTYQVATLTDHIQRTGDILSPAELAAVDGFSEERVRLLEPFISFATASLPGQTRQQNRSTENELTLRSAGRIEGLDLFSPSDQAAKTATDPSPEASFNYGIKYRLGIGQNISLGLAANRSYDAAQYSPDGGSFFLALYGRRTLGKFILGSFRQRFGQGLSVWNGFRINTLSSISSFYMRPSGISPAWSFSGSGTCTGIAADFNIDRVTVSASVAFTGLSSILALADLPSWKNPGLTPTLNATWFGRNAQLGVTLTSAVTLSSAKSVSADVASGPVWGPYACSFDFRWCIRGTDLFGEVAFDSDTGRPKAVFGTVFRPATGVEMALRASSSDEESAAAAGFGLQSTRRVTLDGHTGFGSSVPRHTAFLSAEGTSFHFPKYGDTGTDSQLKLLLNYRWQATGSFALALRASERLRTRGETHRTDIRLDFLLSRIVPSGQWSLNVRANGLYSRSFAMLAYLEAGWRQDLFYSWLRIGAFKVDYWQDRIYVYERDAPGNFNVPAYYGRGVWAAMTVGLNRSWDSIRARLYLRISALQYPDFGPGPTSGTRTPRLEARLLLVFRI